MQEDVQEEHGEFPLGADFDNLSGVGFSSSFQSKPLLYFGLLCMGKADVSVAANLHFQFRSKTKFSWSLKSFYPSQAACMTLKTNREIFLFMLKVLWPFLGSFAAYFESCLMTFAIQIYQKKIHISTEQINRKQDYYFKMKCWNI